MPCERCGSDDLEVIRSEEGIPIATFRCVVCGQEGDVLFDPFIAPGGPIEAVRLSVVWPSPPSVEQLRVLRQLIPSFAHEPPVSLRQRFLHENRLRVGVFVRSQAEERAELYRSKGLHVELESTDEPLD